MIRKAPSVSKLTNSKQHLRLGFYLICISASWQERQSLETRSRLMALQSSYPVELLGLLLKPPPLKLIDEVHSVHTATPHGSSKAFQVATYAAVNLGFDLGNINMLASPKNNVSHRMVRFHPWGSQILWLSNDDTYEYLPRKCTHWKFACNFRVECPTAHPWKNQSPVDPV